MNSLKIFENNEFGKVRVVMIENAPWFVAVDVCKCLELTDTSKAVKRLDDDEKGATLIPTLGGTQKLLIVNEYGLYNLILASRKPEAKSFKRWITHEVLPSIRKHGAYLTEKALRQAVTDPDFLIKLATELKHEKLARKAAESDAKIAWQRVGELQPKADYTDTILKNSDLVNITQIAKDYGMSGVALNRKLHELHVIYQCRGQWLLYSPYQAKGYTHSETISYRHKNGRPGVKMCTKWTQKGRLFLYQKLKRHGILPLIEQEGTA